MIIGKFGNAITLLPDDGKWLTNGEVYTNSIVFLGINDKVENWNEVDELPEVTEDIE